MIHKFCCQYYIFDKFYSMYGITFVLFVNSVLHNICILYKLYYFILWFLWNSFTRHMFILRYHCTIHVCHRVWPQYWATASQGSHPHSYRWPVASSAPRSGRPSWHGSYFLWFWVFLLPHLYIHTMLLGRTYFLSLHSSSSWENWRYFVPRIASVLQYHLQ